MEKYKVKEYFQTCSACPSQWDITTTDGHYIYARYRWGFLSVTIHPFTKISETLLGKQIGDNFDGVLSTCELKALTKDILEW